MVCAVWPGVVGKRGKKARCFRVQVQPPAAEQRAAGTTSGRGFGLVWQADCSLQTAALHAAMETLSLSLSLAHSISIHHGCKPATRHRWKSGSKRKHVNNKREKT